jgi:hypothetical protein
MVVTKRVTVPQLRDLLIAREKALRRVSEIQAKIDATTSLLSGMCEDRADIKEGILNEAETQFALWCERNPIA